jgi:hypothetical protein
LFSNTITKTCRTRGVAACEGEVMAHATTAAAHTNASPSAVPQRSGADRSDVTRGRVAPLTVAE